MSFNFRDDNGIFGANASIELNNGASASTLVKQQIVEYVQYNSATTGTNTLIFMSPSNASVAATAQPLGSYAVVEVMVRYATSSTSGVVQVEKTPSGTAVGSGTNLLATAISTSGTALNTTVYGFPSTSLSNANAMVSNGDGFSVIFGGTQTSLTNLAVTIGVVRVV